MSMPIKGLAPMLQVFDRHLQAKGIAVQEPAIAHYGMKQLYVTDPDGFNVCFQWPGEPQP